MRFDLVSDPESPPPLVDESRLIDFLTAAREKPKNFLDVQASGLISLPADVAHRIDDLIKMRMHLPNGIAKASLTSRGPTPTSWTKEVSYVAEAPAFTYALQFGSKLLWKVGHTQNVQERLKEINLHIPSEIIGESWQVMIQQKWSTQKDAFAMEQAVLASLDEARTLNERVQCSKETLQRAWVDACVSVRRR